MAVQKCLHCNHVLTAVWPTRQPLDPVSRALFCSNGCQLAHTIILQAGLGQYYLRCPGPRIPGRWELSAPELERIHRAQLSAAARRFETQSSLVIQAELHFPHLHCVHCCDVINGLATSPPGVLEFQLLPEDQKACLQIDHRSHLSEVLRILSSAGFPATLKDL